MTPASSAFAVCSRTAYFNDISVGELRYRHALSAALGISCKPYNSFLPREPMPLENDTIIFIGQLPLLENVKQLKLIQDIFQGKINNISVLPFTGTGCIRAYTNSSAFEELKRSFHKKVFFGADRLWYDETPQGTVLKQILETLKDKKIHLRLGFPKLPVCIEPYTSAKNSLRALKSSDPAILVNPSYPGFTNHRPSEEFEDSAEFLSPSIFSSPPPSKETSAPISYFYQHNPHSITKPFIVREV